VAALTGLRHHTLYAVGERNDLPGYRRVARDVRQAVSEWSRFAAAAELDEETTQDIAGDMRRFAPR
jgi:hypothetical protein